MCRWSATGVGLSASIALFACKPPVASTGGPPVQNAEVPSQYCRGDAPVDDDVKQVPLVRASWFNDVGGTKRLYVLEAGPRDSKEPTLVLIHGVGEIGTGDFYPVLGALSHTRHVLAVDLPGFGRSDLEGEDFGPERLVRSVETVTRACASKQVDVLGHSSGGALALLYAAQLADQVRRLVVVDAAGVLRPEVLLRGQLHQGLTDLREKAPVTAIVAEKVGDLMIEAVHRLAPSATKVGESGLFGKSPPVLAATRLLDFNFGEAIRDIRAQTLVIWGKNDQVVPPRIAHLLDDRIANSEVTFMEDAGHVPMKDQPELFASVVSGYLNSGKPREPKHQPANTATRLGQCKGEENVDFEGDYARIEVNDCKRVWLNKVRTKTLVIKNSQGVIDSPEVTESVIVENSELAWTGGELRGDVAMTVSDSNLDIAGVDIEGKRAAIRVAKKSEIVFSVTPLHSPKNDRIFHGSKEYEDGAEL